MYAVFETGGKQYRAAPGDSLRVEKLPAEQGATVEFDRVLLMGGGAEVTVGTPYVSGGRVTATVVAHGRRPKVDVVKFRRRKNSRRRTAHRQHYTEVRITDISAQG